MHVISKNSFLSKHAYGTRRTAEESFQTEVMVILCPFSTCAAGTKEAKRMRAFLLHLQGTVHEIKGVQRAE